MTTALRSVGPADFSSAVMAQRGGEVYVVYLVQPNHAARIAHEIKAELHAFDDRILVEVVETSPGAAHLLPLLPSLGKDVLLVDAEAYTKADWSLLDRRRSALAREGVTIFLTTAESFDLLMNVAPNLASWFGALVFSCEDPVSHVAQQRKARLAALREWAGATDEEMVHAAEQGRLPRDPEYAEWLVLINRGDLLDA